MKTMYLFLAEGFEEVEALAPLDVMRRAGLHVMTVSVTGQKCVAGAHGVGIMADALFEDLDFQDAALLFLPGGLPGATNLNEYEPLRELIQKKTDTDVVLAAICAAPLVLGGLNVLRGKRATCYPGFENYMKGAIYTPRKVVTDGNIMTGCGPAAAFDLGFAIVRHFCGDAKADELYEGMQFTR